MPVPEAAKRMMQRLWDEADADYRSQILALLPRDPSGTLLDVGCDDGAWTAQLAARAELAPDRVAGIEVVENRRAIATGRGFDVRGGDLEARWPFDDDAFSVVHANQVIEHVKRLDHFLEELRRVLRPDGLALVCTENLASWHNVAALVLGHMPFSLTNISNRGAIGNPYALHAGEDFIAGESWQHIHVVTLGALEHLFTLHGFRVEHRFGAGWYPATGSLGRRFARRDPRHAHFIGVLARLG